MRHRAPNPFAGSLLASVAAGPVTALAVGLAGLISNPNAVDPVQAGQLLGIGVVLLIPATLVALLPNLVGTALMLWIGRRIEMTRFPVIWALVGAATLGVPLAWCATPGDTVPLAGALIGAACAAICRGWAYWPDEAEPSVRRSVSTTPQAINACPAK